jgi:recombinational DNA repair ATPase RecF
VFAARSKQKIRKKKGGKNTYKMSSEISNNHGILKKKLTKTTTCETENKQTKGRTTSQHELSSWSSSLVSLGLGLLIWRAEHANEPCDNGEETYNQYLRERKKIKHKFQKDEQRKTKNLEDHEPNI